MFFLKDLPTREMLGNYKTRYPGMNPEAVAGALQLLRRASLLMRELDTYFKVYRLSQTGFLVMIVIDREPEKAGLLASQIADRLDVSRPVITETVKTLMRARLLSAAPVPDDGRAKFITLTVNGHAVLADLLPGYFTLIDDFLARGHDRTA